MMDARAFFIRHERKFRRVVLALGVVALITQFVAAFRPRGDFLLHWEFGRRFLFHEPLYAGGLHVPYPPFWAMANAPLALLPVWVAKPVFYLLGVVALLVMMRLLAVLAPVKGSAFWMQALVLFLASRFVLRDLADGGQNLVLVALVWGSIWCGIRGSLVLAGSLLGLAVALKCTALIFIGWLFWKGRVRVAGASLVFAVAFSFAPALWMGPEAFARDMEQWGGTVFSGLTQSDPSIGVLGPEKFQNHGLRPASARFLMHLPEGHPGRFDSPWYGEFLDLSPALAGKIITGLIVLLGGFVIWNLRGRLTPENAVWQFAAISVFMLLLSPITWGQHCVAAWPALWVLAREARECGRGRLVLLVFGVLVLLTNRGLLGKPLSLLLASYHLTTLALLLLLVASLVGARRFQREEADGDSRCSDKELSPDGIPRRF